MGVNEQGQALKNQGHFLSLDQASGWCNRSGVAAHLTADHSHSALLRCSRCKSCFFSAWLTLFPCTQPLLCRVSSAFPSPGSTFSYNPLSFSSHHRQVTGKGVNTNIYGEIIRYHSLATWLRLFFSVSHKYSMRYILSHSFYKLVN